jgi:phosphate transport system protein
MVFELFRGRGGSQVETIEAQIGEMLATTNETFGMAIDALMRRVAPEEIGKPLRKADKSVNKVERAIRRELVVHAGVRGTDADVPLLLTYMSIAKDIERVGDLTKDMWDLAAAGVDVGAYPYGDEVPAHAEVVSTLIDDTARIFAERDADAAMALLNQTDDLKDQYEELMLSQLTSGASTREAVARALLYRYIHRIIAHLMNVMTAVVMPLDRLDYWDEDKVDRD